jgi:hypothetical protein
MKTPPTSAKEPPGVSETTKAGGGAVPNANEAANTAGKILSTARPCCLGMEGLMMIRRRAKSACACTARRRVPYRAAHAHGEAAPGSESGKSAERYWRTLGVGISPAASSRARLPAGNPGRLPATAEQSTSRRPPAWHLSNLPGPMPRAAPPARWSIYARSQDRRRTPTMMSFWEGWNAARSRSTTRAWGCGSRWSGPFQFSPG